MINLVFVSNSIKHIVAYWGIKPLFSWLWAKKPFRDAIVFPKFMGLTFTIGIAIPMD